MSPLNNEVVYNSKVIGKRTPDGTLFVIINEDRKTGKPVMIQMNIGKAGSSLSAWTYAMSAVCTLALEKGATIEELITLISNTNSDKLVMDATQPIRSGPAGLAQALIVYNHDRFEELEKEFASRHIPKRAQLFGRSARG